VREGRQHQQARCTRLSIIFDIDRDAPQDETASDRPILISELREQRSNVVASFAGFLSGWREGEGELKIKRITCVSLSCVLIMHQGRRILLKLPQTNPIIVDTRARGAKRLSFGRLHSFMTNSARPRGKRADYEIKREELAYTCGC